MRNVLALAALCVALIGAPAYAQKSSSKKTTAIKTSNDSLSYAIGATIGSNLKESGMAINVDVFAQAISDVLGDKTLAISKERIGAVLQALQQQMANEEVAKRQAAGAENKRAGEAFLAQNKTRAGVVALPSGLQYEVITEGTGAQPKATDKVTTHYRGTLIDGTPFDASYDRGEPATFQLDQVIGGWTEALQLMKVGSKWRLFVPPHLAYGEGGAPGGKIGPNSTLVFEVELLQVN